ncbi:bacteriochlorophyll 4-vinyl reductase [Elioraea rosea]|uniref:bacteriochlorophyll 4-vinyl reductase n=1 Tax=Elioraea rosea TaxID=2492390 RepID=UPI0013155653|nr:bacteriochlorophyll 4-vinyl reductase [Elioraea rosea]
MAEAQALDAAGIALASGAARIGPNAIIQLAAALAEEHGEAAASAVFHRAGLPGWLDHAPGAMVPEADVAALHRALVEHVSEPEARGVAASAGRRTAAYLLANRIPGAVQGLLRLLPPWPSSRVLLRAIGRNAWTFVGSGTLSVAAGHPIVVTISGGPLRAAGSGAPCVAAYYAATFEGLFRALVHPEAHAAALSRLTETNGSCAFCLSWAPPQASLVR